MLKCSSYKISVIVPVLNNRTGLQRCLNSIACQPVGCVELIIIDGGSNDGTLDVIKDYQSIISYWETGKDKGISDAFNRGIKQATAKYIAILNSDDYWQPNYINCFFEAINNFPEADVYYGKIRYFDSSTGASYLRSPDISKMKKRMYLFHPAIFVCREAYKKVGGYSLVYKYAMDSEWCHRAMAQKLHFQFIDSELAVMELGGVSDKNYKKALAEYRCSLIFHGLSGPFFAYYYFWKYFILKSLTQIRWIRSLKQRLLK